jgi:hypothetical protein
MVMNPSTSVPAQAGPNLASPKPPSSGRRGQTVETKPLGKRLRTLLLVLVALLGVGSVVYYVCREGSVERLKRLGKELQGESGKQLTAERQQKWQVVREEFNKLTPQERFEVDFARRQRERAKLAAFFKKSRKEQEAELTQEILRIEAARKQWLAQRAANGGGTGTAGAAAVGPQRQATGGSVRPGPESQEQRMRRAKDNLDTQSPAERVQMDTYNRMRFARRQAMGLGGGGRGR